MHTGFGLGSPPIPPLPSTGGWVGGSRTLTRAVTQIAFRGCCQVVDEVAARASLDLHRHVPQATVAAPVRTGLAGHDAFVAGRVRAIEPHGRRSVAVQAGHAALSQAHASLACEAVPAIQARVAGVARAVFGAAPKIVQGAVRLARIFAHPLLTPIVGHAVQPRAAGTLEALAVPPVPLVAFGTHAGVVAFAVDA